MLRLVDNGAPNDLAYRVPWKVDRTHAPSYSILNSSAETAFRVCYQFLEASMPTPVALCGEVEPGERFIINAQRAYPDELSVSITWLRADGAAYVWTFAD